jgi:flagellar biosynthesis/type III secretory pathway protein FliH
MSKKEDLSQAILKIAASVIQSYPDVSEEEIYSAIVEYMESLASNPQELAMKMNLPSRAELNIHNRREIYK